MATYTFDEMFDHTASSPRTMMDSDGYIKYAPHNIFPSSVDPSNSTYWTLNLASADIVANTSYSNPNGELGAFRLSTQTTGNNTYIYRDYNAQGKPHRYSVFAKADDASWLRLNFSSALTYGAWFNLATGTIGTVLAPVKQAFMIDVGDGWYYCSVEYDNPLSSSERWVIGVTNGDNTVSGPTSGTGIYLWGPMLTRSDLELASNPNMNITLANTAETYATYPDAYMPSYDTAISAPRRNTYYYNTNTSAYEPKGLLLETESRTNLFATSDDPVNAFSVSDGISTSANTSLGPAFDTAYLVSTNGSGRKRLYSVSIPHTGQYFKTLSFFYHPKTGSENPFVHIFFQDSVGTLKGFCLNSNTDEITQLYNASTPSAFAEFAEVIDYGNGWKRFIATAENLAVPSNVNLTCQLMFSSTATNGSGAVLGDAFFMYGLQMEEGFGASSYIPTDGASETKDADTLKITQQVANDVFFGSTATINLSGNLRYVEEDSSNTTVGLYEWYSDANNYLAAVLNTQNGTGSYDFYVKYQGNETVLSQLEPNFESEGNDVYFNVSQSVDALQNQLDASVEGTNEANVSIAGLFSLTPSDFYLGAVNSLNSPFMGTLEQLRIWDIALNNDELSTETEVIITPDQINGLQIWFDAADTSTITTDGSDNLTSITDKSGNGNDSNSVVNMKSNQQTVNDKNVLSPSAIGGYFRFPTGTSSSEVTVFILKNRRSPDTNETPAKLILLGGDSTADFYGVFEDSSTLTSIEQNIFDIGSDANSVRLNDATFPTRPNRGDLWSEQISFSSEGDNTFTGKIYFRATGLSLPSISDVRTSYSGTSFTHDDEICEIIVYNRILSQTEIDRVDLYMQNKWNTSVPNANLLFVDTGSNFAEWTTVGAEAVANTTFGNPAPCYSVDLGSYMYVSTGVTDLRNKRIEFTNYNSTDTTTTSLSNFFFGANSSGDGLMLRIESRSGFTSAIRASTGFAYSDFPSFTLLQTLTDKRTTSNTWTNHRIDIDSSLVMTWYVNDVLWATQDISSHVHGDYICIHSDAPTIDIGTSFWDNFKITAL